MNYILFDDLIIRENLLPLTYTRPVALMRVGILTIAEKWEKYLNTQVRYFTESYLQEKYPVVSGDKNLFINGAVCPTAELVAEIQTLADGTTLVYNGTIIAYKKEPSAVTKAFEHELTIIKNVWDIFEKNGSEIRKDFVLVTANRISEKIGDIHTKVYNSSQIFIEKGVKIYGAILNAEFGPIYIGKNAEVGEGAMIRGPFAMGESACVNMGGKMRGDTTVGPFSKVGGEVSNSVLFAYSNKGHDGFLGNSVLGEWCNLGAGATTSNLKNNYGTTQLYNYKKKGLVDTGRQFCGLIMGDHSKGGINSSFNTATMVGVFANIFGPVMPDKFVPSFSWGVEGEIYRLEKAFEVAEKVMERRNKVLDDVEKRILTHVYNNEIGNF